MSDKNREEQRAKYEQWRKDERDWRFNYRNQAIVAAVNRHIEIMAPHYPGNRLEDLADYAGITVEKAQEWLSGTYDFRMSELTYVEQFINEVLHAVPMVGKYPETLEEFKVYDDNLMRHPLNEVKCEGHSYWCSACNWTGDTDEKTVYRAQHKNLPPRAECPNCGRVCTIQSID